MINPNDELNHEKMKRKKNKAVKKRTGKKATEMAGLAMKHEFYLEASWILSSLFESKLGKILDKIQPQSQRQGLTFAQLIKRIKYLHLSAKHPAFTEHFRPGLIDEIRNWKNQRNDVLKDMPDVHVSQARLERLANDGARLYKELNKTAKSFKPEDEVSGGEKG